MSSPESMLPAEARQGSPFAAAPPSRWDAVDAKLSTLSEYINPILVKETRQALKSRLFLITFSLLLVAGWGWSLFVVSQFFPAIYYAPQGAFMLSGYFCILCLPLMVIVPFSAFRSLSGEVEDGTFELVSITTLHPRQIVGGKLGSAVVQMLIYLSALTPAMAFSYMLRGVDILMILMVVFYLVLVSVALSIVGLLLATVTNSRQWQMVLGVIYILGLAFLFMLGLTFGVNVIVDSVMPYDEPHFWGAQLFVITIIGSYTALFYLSAMARITFVSDNRSTKIRTCLLIIQALAVTWAAWYWLMEEEDGILIAFLVWAGFHWWLMGALMVGESTEISPRVRRSLPATFMGRAFSIWLYPGPGTGYVLMATCFGALVALVGAATIGTSITEILTGSAAAVQASVVWKIVLLAVVLVLCVAGSLFIYATRNQPTAIALFASFFFAIVAGSSLLFLIATMIPAASEIDGDVFLVALFIYCYLLIYLGVTRLVMMVIDRWVQGGVFLAALWSILFVLFGVFFPMIVQGLVSGMFNDPYWDYSALQVSNPFWTIVAVDGGDLTNIPFFGLVNVPFEAIILGLTATGMLLLNLMLAAREVDRQREETPDRVLEELRELHPEKAIVEKASSPWDGDAG